MNIAENYLHDLAPLILERARDAKQRAETEGDPFERGQQTAFYTVLSLMKQQAIAFGISDDAIGLANVDLDRELLS